MFLLKAGKLMFTRMTDEAVRQWVQRMRRKLGYFDLPEIEPREPGPVARFFYKIFSKVGEFFLWLFQNGGWKLAVIILALLLLFLLYRMLRNIQFKKRSALAELENRDTNKNSVIVWNKNKDEWLQSMKEYRDNGNYDLAVVALYRANLAAILEEKKLNKQLSNREISRQLSAGKKTFFTRLYKTSDAVVFGNRHCEASLFSELILQHRELSR